MGGHRAYLGGTLMEENKHDYGSMSSNHASFINKLINIFISQEDRIK